MASERKELLRALKQRFESNPQRHEGIEWSDVEARLESHRDALKSLQAMEASGGEPDVIGRDKNGRFTFCDCSEESPTGRRSLCYDREARNSRKENKPESSAVEMAAEMGVTMLTEEQYRALQELGEFDAKTSSWVETPADVRASEALVKSIQERMLRLKLRRLTTRATHGSASTGPVTTATEDQTHAENRGAA